jgi:hypothetical protein
MASKKMTDTGKKSKADKEAELKAQRYEEDEAGCAEGLVATESNKEFEAIKAPADEALENAVNGIAGPNDKVSSEIIKWDVKLELDDERAHELGLDMAQRMKRIGEIERHKAAVSKECKDEITGHEDLIRKSAKILTDGIESKEMDCQMVRNFTRGVCYVVRIDTRAVVETIAMEGDAAQMELPEVEEEEAKEEAKVDGRERRITGKVKGYCGKCERNLADYEDEVFGTLCSDCQEQIWDDEDAVIVANAHRLKNPSKAESAGE